MGTVWLARQLSLDRDVAVKVLRPSLADDPQFVYRFTQEALAAAQLVHHHVVQVYDCGSDKGVHFFSMELVDDESLASRVEREGRMDAEVAAGYILQAARGLKFAHDRGMVHRDIKPDNLLLNRNGIVKVADLGLVKQALVEHTRQRRLAQRSEASASSSGASDSSLERTMGTPAYMAPEQFEDSSAVDARADIYSLGCTLYHLLTGQPPFQADSLVGVMSLHMLEPPVSPSERAPRVPVFLSQLVLRMMAKRAQERPAHIDDVIQALEAFLGIDSAAAFSPREEHASFLESSVEGFNQAHWARRRRWLVAGFALLAAGVTGGLGWRLGARPALVSASFVAATWMFSFCLRGLLQKGALFLRFRQLVFQAPLVTWAAWLLAWGGAAWALYSFRLHLWALGLLGAALVCALGFCVLVDRRVAAQRRPFVEGVEQMLRTMRLRGLEEGALRQFVCKYGGERWEPFYEALFGYDAKLLAREKWGRNDRDLPRKKHATWREPLIRAMDALQASRQRRREQRHLRKLARA
jgi:hypothetical protein